MRPFYMFLRQQFCFCILIMTVWMSGYCFALEQNEKLWLAINAQQTLSKDEQWLTFIYSQLRLIDNSHPWQALLLEGGIGHRLLTEDSIWLGYRWTGHHFSNGFYQENRIFQQYIWQKKLKNLYQLIARSRLEEIQRSNENKIALRFRQRLAVEIRQVIFTNLFPALYDEIFFSLNKTNYTPHTFISENRLFLGFNFYVSKQAWWEIGYINQYQMSNPQQSQNQMNHILSITYNFL